MRRVTTFVVLAACLAVPTAAAAPGDDAAPTGGTALARCHLRVLTNEGDTKAIYRLFRSEPRRDWRLKIFQDDVRVYSALHRADADGRFKAVTHFPDLPRRNVITARARDLVTGSVCAITLRV